MPKTAEEVNTDKNNRDKGAHMYNGDMITSQFRNKTNIRTYKSNMTKYESQACVHA